MVLCQSVEDGSVITISCHSEGVGGIRRHHIAVFRPVVEGEAVVGRGRQSALGVFIIGACTRNRTPCIIVSIGANGVWCARHCNGAEIGLVLLAGNHHIECAAAGDGLSEVHGSHTRRIGLGNTIDDRAVVGNGDVGTGQGVHSDGGGTRGDRAGYRHGVRFRLGDVRHDRAVTKGVVELEIIVSRVVAVATFTTT